MRLYHMIQQPGNCRVYDIFPKMTISIEYYVTFSEFEVQALSDGQM